MSITEGDMVITAGGKIGLLVGFTRDGKAAVRFVNNGPLHGYDPTSLRPASLPEIEASPLAGVGCNQAQAFH